MADAETVISRSKFKTFLAKQRLSLATRAMENEMVRIVNLAEGHKAADLQPGHVYFQALQKRAKKSISDYQTTVGKLGFSMPTYLDIAVGIPMLKELDDLANGAIVRSTASSMLAAAPAVIAVLAVAGTLVFTFCQIMHHYLVHWIVR